MSEYATFKTLNCINLCWFAACRNWFTAESFVYQKSICDDLI